MSLEAKNQRIRATYVELCKCDKEYLVGEYCRANRVTDEVEVRKMRKTDIATDILVCEYGRKAVEAAF